MILEPVRVVYIDDLILRCAANFAFDYLLLWAVASVTRTRSASSRLCAASGLGTAYALVTALAEWGVLPFYGTLRYPPLALSIPVAMLWIAFYPQPVRCLLTVTGYFYVIFLTSGGAGLLAAMYAFGTPDDPAEWAGTVVSAATVLVIAEAGWGAIQNVVWHRLYNVELQLSFGNRTVSCGALLDTGNMLTDPITQAPVIITEQSVVSEALPPEVSDSLPGITEARAESLSAMNRHPEWGAKLRLLPYSSIGNTSGILVGLRPDSARILSDGHSIELGSVVVGLCDQPLSRDRSYRALINPRVVSEAMGVAYKPGASKRPDLNASGRKQDGSPA